MIDIIISVIVVLALAFAVRHLIIGYKKGNGCCGCPNSSVCLGDCRHNGKDNKV